MRCMSIYSIQPTPLGAVRTYPLASRKSKVSIRDFANPPRANSSLTKFLDSLPSILAAEDLRQLLAAVHRPRRQRKAILCGIGVSFGKFDRRHPRIVLRAMRSQRRVR